MKFTATELSRNPNKVFRAAYDAKGDPVTIVHGQYSEGFEIRLKQSERPVIIQTDQRLFPVQMMPDDLTDDQKHAIILKMTASLIYPSNGINVSFIDDLPGYAILSSHSLTRLTSNYRWTNYKMMNGLADSMEECEAKARAHAAKDKGHE